MRAHRARMAAFSLILDKTTEYGKTYKGETEIVKFHFKVPAPEQVLDITGWVKGKYLDKQINEIESQGGKVIRVRIWRDKAPTWHTNFKGEIIADVRGETKMGSGAYMRSAAFWAAVLAAAFLAWLIKPVIDSVAKLAWGIASVASNTWVLLLAGFILLSWKPWEKKETQKQEAQT